jgi:hypothetical protein
MYFSVNTNIARQVPTLQWARKNVLICPRIVPNASMSMDNTLKQTNTPKLDSVGRGLANDLCGANTLLHYSDQLSKAWRGEFKTEMSKSSQFWGATIRAHRQIAVIGLCRLYDQYERTHFSVSNLINLESFAGKLKNPPNSDAVSKFISTKLSEESRECLSKYNGGQNLELRKALIKDLNRIVDKNHNCRMLLENCFPSELSQVGTTLHLLCLLKMIDEIGLTPAKKHQLERDRQFLIRPAPRIKVLRNWRNQVFSHRDSDLHSEDAELQNLFFDENRLFPLTIKGLIYAGFAILQRWTPCFQQYPITRKFFSDKSDYQFVLESLRAGLSRTHPPAVAADADKLPKETVSDP